MHTGRVVVFVHYAEYKKKILTIVNMCASFQKFSSIYFMHPIGYGCFLYSRKGWWCSSKETKNIICYICYPGDWAICVNCWAKRCNLENSAKATKSLKGLESQRRQNWSIIFIFRLNCLRNNYYSIDEILTWHRNRKRYCIIW